jgi:hypothetical protein
MALLPIPSPKERKEKPWFISGWSNPERATMTAKALEMTCIPKKVGMDSGSGFKAKPLRKFPADHVIFEYSVHFPDDFNWVKGGKLPGLGLGPGDDAATGSDWQDALGSVRVMWREQGQGIAYLYLPLEIAKDGTRDGTIKVQGKAFEDAAEGSLGKHAGIDVFFKNRAGLQFSKGQWNTVRIQVKLNTPGKSDGFFELTINDETRRVDNVIFRKSKDIRINLALVVAFFGGSTLEWAAKKKETLSFKDFNITCP